MSTKKEILTNDVVISASAFRDFFREKYPGITTKEIVCPYIRDLFVKLEALSEHS